MKGLLQLTVILLITSFLSAQEDLNLQLEEIKSEKVDSIKVNLYNDLSNSLFRKDPDAAILYAEKGAALAEKIQFKKGLGYAYNNIGLGYYVKGEFREVIINWEKSLAIFQSIDLKLGISNLQSNIGAVYQTKGDDPTALDFFIKSMRNATQLNDTTRIATAYLNMGTVYSNEKTTYDEALDSYEQAMAMFEAINYEEGIAISALNIGELLLLENKPEEALEYFQASMKANEAIDGDLSVSLKLMGTAYVDLGDLDKAEETLMEAISMAERRGSKMEQTMALNELGKVYLQRRDYGRAIEIFKKALNLTITTQVLRDRTDSLEGLAEAYSALGNYEEAYSNQRLYVATQDTIRDEQYEKTLGNLRFEFDIENKEQQIELLNTENELKETQIANEENSRKLLLALTGFLGFVIFGIILQYRYVRKSHKVLDGERNRSESILLNILPKETAEELKQNGFIKAKKFDSTTVLFTDFKAFSLVAEQISPEKLVKSVDYYFKQFDKIIERHSLEKIKTIGDAYMCAGGLPSANASHPTDAVNAAEDILDFVIRTEKDPPNDIYPFKVRIGINTGQVIAGVVGTKKFQYDIWGNTVNIASRMESNSEPGRINVSENTYNLLKDKRKFTYRGEIEVKNGMKLKMYYLDTENKMSS